MERQSPPPDFLWTHGGPRLIGRHQPAWTLIGGERARVALQSDVTESSRGGETSVVSSELQTQLLTY